MFFDIHHLPCLIALAPYSPPSPGRAEQSEGREGGAEEEGGRGDPQPPFSPGTLEPIYSVVVWFLPQRSNISLPQCSVSAIVSCYLLHCSTENPGVLSIFLLRCALDPILRSDLGVPFTDSYHMVWGGISMVSGEVNERDN